MGFRMKIAFQTRRRADRIGLNLLCHSEGAERLKNPRADPEPRDEILRGIYLKLILRIAQDEILRGVYPAAGGVQDDKPAKGSG